MIPKLPIERRAPGFRITYGSGFKVTFENGWTVSTIFGYGSYSSNRDDMFVAHSALEFEQRNRALGEQGSPDAEVAIIDPEGRYFTPNGQRDGEVLSYQSPEEFFQLLAWAQQQPPKANPS